MNNSPISFPLTARQFFYYLYFVRTMSQIDLHCYWAKEFFYWPSCPNWTQYQVLSALKGMRYSQDTFIQRAYGGITFIQLSSSFDGRNLKILPPEFAASLPEEKMPPCQWHSTCDSFKNYMMLENYFRLYVSPIFMNKLLLCLWIFEPKVLSTF